MPGDEGLGASGDMGDGEFATIGGDGKPGMIDDSDLVVAAGRHSCRRWRRGPAGESDFAAEDAEAYRGRGRRVAGCGCGGRGRRRSGFIAAGGGEERQKMEGEAKHQLAKSKKVVLLSIRVVSKIG